MSREKPSSHHWVPIIAAIITASAVVVAAYIGANAKQQIEALKAQNEGLKNDLVAAKSNPRTIGPSVPEGRQFTGRVRDAKSGEKIRGAMVSLEAQGIPPVLYTDSEGVFTFPLKGAPKSVRLVIDSRGYETYDRRIDPNASSGIEEIRLTPRVSSRGEAAATSKSRPEKPKTYPSEIKSVNEKSAAKFFDDQVIIAVGECVNNQPVTLTVIPSDRPSTICSNMGPMSKTPCNFLFKRNRYSAMVTAVGDESATVTLSPAGPVT